MNSAGFLNDNRESWICMRRFARERGSVTPIAQDECANIVALRESQKQRALVKRGIYARWFRRSDQPAALHPLHPFSHAPMHHVTQPFPSRFRRIRFRFRVDAHVPDLSTISLSLLLAFRSLSWTHPGETGSYQFASSRLRERSGIKLQFCPAKNARFCLSKYVGYTACARCCPVSINSALKRCRGTLEIILSDATRRVPHFFLFHLLSSLGFVLTPLSHSQRTGRVQRKSIEKYLESSTALEKCNSGPFRWAERFRGKRNPFANGGVLAEGT